MPDATDLRRHRTWKSVLYVPGYYIVLGIFGSGAWWFSLLVALATRLGNPPEAELLRRRLRRLLAAYVVSLRVLCGLRVEYLGWPADWERQLSGAIFAANHPSLLDAPLLLSRSPQFICLYKGALERTVLWPETASAAGYLSNRSGIDTVRAAVGHLQAGRTLLLFPEGTRSPRGGLGRFEPGGALIALRAQAPVQTLLIRMSTPALTKERSKWAPPLLPLTVVLEWGERLTPSPGETTQAFKARLESGFHNALTAASPAAHD